MSKWTYIGNWVVGLSVGLVFLIAGIISASAIPSTSPSEPYFLALVLSYVGWAGFAWAGLTLLRFVHRMWAALPAARISPRRAVALLFVPVFNLYWIARVFCGFAREANSILEPAGRGRLPLALFTVFSETCALAMVGAAVTFALPFSPAGRAFAVATFACAGLAAILAVYVMAVAGDAVVILEDLRAARPATVTAQ